ncbi:MAG: DUF3322 domain-containing protein [Burkholderiales bacterium]
MSWTTPADLREQVQKFWDKGLVLSSLVEGQAIFPRRLVLRAPSSTEIADQFDAVRKWIADLRQATPCRIEMREWRHRIHGANAIPDAVWIDSVDEALDLIGKQREYKRFGELLELTRTRQPLLLPWMAKRALRVLELADEWPLLLDIIAWMQAHPRPGIYLRQIDVPGVHSKFIEMQRAVLIELLDLALPPSQVETQAAGVANFCRRFGFRDKPLRIRFRMLDGQYAMRPGGADQDFTVSHQAFAELNPQVRRVFITENEINYLALPEVPDSLLIFGAGYGFGMLAEASWLKQCKIRYWGDIDTHGFAILDQLRDYLPDAASFLMDRATLMAHERHWVNEEQATRRDLQRLNREEGELFDDLRFDRLGQGIRLEQERIEFSWIEKDIHEITHQ